MLPWLVKPAALVSVLAPPASVIRRVWPAGTSLARVFALPSRMNVSGLAAGAARSSVAPDRTTAPVIVPPW